MSTLLKQLMLVGAVVMAFVVVWAVALHSQGSNSLVPFEAALKQFTVEKSRKSARGISSSDREVSAAKTNMPSTQRVQSMTPDAKPEATHIQVPVKTDAPIGGKSAEAKRPDSASAIIAESYAAGSTKAAMDMLSRAIADAQSPEDTSRLYAAIGSLKLAQENPDTEAGLAALRSATEAATSPAARSKAAVAEAAALLLHGDREDSLARIEELLEDNDIQVESTHHLTLMRGDLLVERGDFRAAETEYERVRKAALPQVDPNDGLFRQASLRLYRLYARTGDQKKEALIARDLKQAASLR